MEVLLRITDLPDGGCLCVAEYLGAFDPDSAACHLGHQLSNREYQVDVNVEWESSHAD